MTTTSTSTVLLINDVTGLALIFFAVSFLFVLLFILYTFWKPKDYKFLENKQF